MSFQGFITSNYFTLRLGSVPDRRGGCGSREALAHEMGVNSSALARILQEFELPAKTAIERRLEQLAILVTAKDVVEDLPDEIAVDLHREKSGGHPAPAMASNARFRTRDGRCGSPVVDCSLPEEPGDGLVDGLFAEPSFQKPGPHLTFGQLARREPFESAKIGCGERVGVDGRTGLVHVPNSTIRTS
jgi:hypothetical protein